MNAAHTTIIYYKEKKKKKITRRSKFHDTKLRRHADQDAVFIVDIDSDGQNDGAKPQLTENDKEKKNRKLTLSDIVFFSRAG